MIIGTGTMYTLKIQISCQEDWKCLWGTASSGAVSQPTTQAQVDPLISNWSLITCPFGVVRCSCPLNPSHQWKVRLFIKRSSPSALCGCMYLSAQKSGGLSVKPHNQKWILALREREGSGNGDGGVWWWAVSSQEKLMVLKGTGHSWLKRAERSSSLSKCLY